MSASRLLDVASFLVGMALALGIILAAVAATPLRRFVA